ncbi:MAG TPA: hypothetical protein VFB80_17695 [Pirellulaceae bacterium]|nr:hypothetical protein [Pirellulaceae bacterium]
MFRFLPWKFVVQRAARAYGLADPIRWLARLRSFAQASEVAEPIELLRAGILFHARGAVNTKAIQHNLDWIWPYWAQRQFDPRDVSFMPRGFAVSHVNLTHRNWTALGLPELSLYPLVDPRGLLTPLHDGWSLDCWLIDAGGRALVPSRLTDDAVRQELCLQGELAVRTTARLGDLTLEQTAQVVASGGHPAVVLDVTAASPRGGQLVVAIRPYNPEGVQFIDSIAARDGHDGWLVNGRQEVLLDRPAQRLLASDYAGGDVYRRLVDADSAAGAAEPASVRCPVGMATAAAVFPLAGGPGAVQVRVPLQQELAALGNRRGFHSEVTWTTACAEAAELRLPDERMQFLYDASVRTLLLLSADEIVPGPYTYRRFWFRDACLMMNALLAIGLVDRCRRAIGRFPARQLASGYFRSQDGEWDSNGQVLWILDRFELLAAEALPDALLTPVQKAVRWVDRKRTKGDGDALHAGLLPAGFSAEHLGPNDYYYWDDFWSEAGLRAAGRIFARHQRQSDAARAVALARELRGAIDRSLARIPAWRSLGGIPASPYRRMDSGAVGSLVADYPLQLFPPGAPPIMATAEALLRRCFVQGGFFQDVIHSGINAYLTLDIAQTLLRAGDARYCELLAAVAGLASPTGQWPEAIHPHTRGGCMGDGQHGWAAAEWIMLLRNCFVREEADRLIVGSGLLPKWTSAGRPLSFGPTLTPWGKVSVRIESAAAAPVLQVTADWHGQPPPVDVEVPGFQRRRLDGGGRLELEPQPASEAGGKPERAQELRS